MNLKPLYNPNIIKHGQVIVSKVVEMGLAQLFPTSKWYLFLLQLSVNPFVCYIFWAIRSLLISGKKKTFEPLK